MKKYYKVFVLSIMALVCASLMYAQSSASEEQLTAEQIRELIRIQKQEIRQTSKEFLIDDLPELIAADSDKADLALQGFSGVLKLLSDDEVSYLLGHMWTRIGEDDKAITIFDSLLDSDMNEGARKMLNMVLYRKLTKLLNAGDHKAAKELLRFVVFERYNTEIYFPTYLYIYSDLNASDGNYDDATKLIQNYNDNRNVVLNSILPMKQSVLQRLDKMDFTTYLTTPNQVNFNKVNAEIEQIKKDLTGLYSFVMGMKGMIFVDALVKLHEQEMAQLDDLKKNLADYANTSVRTEEQLKLPLSYIDGIKMSIDRMDKMIHLFDLSSRRTYDRLISANEESSAAFKGDLQLNKIITNDSTLRIYRETLDEIDKILASGEHPEHTSRLLAEKRDLEKKVAEAELRNNIYISSLEHSSSDEEKIFSEILREYETYVQLRNSMKLSLDEVENLVRTDIRTTINDDLRDAIRPRIFNTVATVRQSSERDRIFTSGFGEILPNIEFVTLQLAYRNLMAERLQFEQTEMSLPDSTRLATRAELRAEMMDMISDIEFFLTSNPSFTAIEQPGGGNLVGTADLYYNLGELQFEAMPNDMRPALASFRKALQLDPNLPDKDLALYNVAFLSSEVQRSEIEDNRNLYFSSPTASDIRPANTMYLEADFNEALNGFRTIVQDFPSSRLYDESVYRLGLLNFAFAEDAPNSASSDSFRALALGYFDQLADKPESSLHYDAIYQRGWVKLNVMTDEVLRSSMGDFMYLLKAVEAGKIKDTQIAKDYKDDAVKNLAYCLIALDGTDFSTTSRGIAEIRSLFEGYNDSEVISSVVRQATQNKKDMGTNLQAIDFMRLTVDMAPLALQNPTLLDSIWTLYYYAQGRLREGENFATISQNIYQELITNYNHKSKWYEANKDKDILPQLAKVQKAYVEKGKTLYNDFVKDKSRENLLAFQSLRVDFSDYLSSQTGDASAFNAETDSVIVDFYTEMADEKNDESYYIDAVAQLKKYNTQYPQSVNFYDNEVRVLGYSRRIFELSQTKFASVDYTPAPEYPQSLDDAFVIYQDAVFRYSEVVNTERFRNVENQTRALSYILSLADIQNERGKHVEAATLFVKALESDSLLDSATKRATILKLALIEGNAGNHLQSEDWYRKALPLAIDNDDRAEIVAGIRFQIEKSYEAAEAVGNYTLVATERLRLAQEFGPNESSRVLGQKIEAQEAYIKAKEYQKAIDILMDVATSDTDIDAIYSRYDRSIVIADSLMSNKELARDIEQEFIDKFPSSVQAFKLRYARLDELAKVPSGYVQAADGFLALHTETINKTVNPSDTQPSALLQLAIINLNKAKETVREYELLNQFIATYPNHEDVTTYMNTMAEGYFNKESVMHDMQKFEAMAIALYRKDRTQSGPYLLVANTKLKEIATTFDIAYSNKDYTAAFAARDEFRRVESAFLKEGLKLNTEDSYKTFAFVQEEYDNLQKRLAFFRNYDSQMANLEKSELLVKTPAQLVTINDKTTWDKNLHGKGKRFDMFSNVVKAETAKVTKVIKQANDSGYDLDNPRKLRAMNLLARMNDKAFRVVETQVGTYFSVTREGSALLKNYPAEQHSAMIAQTAGNIGSPYLQQVYAYHMRVYSQYHLAGYSDEFTVAAKEYLEAKSWLPDLKFEEQVLNSSWTLSLEKSSGQPRINNINAPKGAALGSLSIPAEDKLTAKKSFNSRIKPDFALLQVMYPYDFEIKVNGSDVSGIWVPVDSLVAGKPATTRFSYYLESDIFADGDNVLEVIFPNTTSVEQQLAVSLHLYTDKERLRNSIPPLVTDIYTNEGWRVINTNPETSEETKTYAAAANNWGIAWDNIQDISPNAAKAIWVNETDSTGINNVVFEVDFMIDTDFISGIIDFVAPETCSIFLNGTPIAENVIFDYEPEPLEVFPSQLTIPAAQVVTGKNTLRFVINNSLSYRGFLAAIAITQTGKEDIR